MKKLYIFFIALALISIHIGMVQAENGTVTTLDQWKSDGTNITQRTDSKPIKLTGLADGCLGLSSGIVGSSGSACGSGGGGGTSAYEIATTSTIAVPGLAYFTKTSGRTTLGSVASTTLTATAPIVFSNAISVIGSTPSVATCNVASGSQPGCLASADWTTFNNKPAFPFTIQTYFGQTVSATSTALRLTGSPYSLFASSTSLFEQVGVNVLPAFATLEVQGTTTTATGRVFALWNSASTPLVTTLNNGNTGIGTTTPQYPLTSVSATGPQLSLGEGSGKAQITLRNEGGIFVMSTTTVAGTATSTPDAFAVNMNSGTAPGLNIATGTPQTAISTAIVNLGANAVSTNASTTIHMGRMQWEGMSSAGVYQCAYFVGSALVVQSGLCNN